MGDDSPSDRSKSMLGVKPTSINSNNPFKTSNQKMPAVVLYSDQQAEDILPVARRSNLSRKQSLQSINPNVSKVSLGGLLGVPSEI